MKRTIILLLSALCTAATAFAYDFQSGDLYYNITSENTVEVTYQVYRSENKNYQGLTAATIPATVTYDGTTYSVTSIGEYAFYHCFALTSITIPNSVTRIGNYAFENCSSLTSITIPNSVTSIAYGVFRGCSSLPVVDNLCYADTYLVEAVDKSLSTYTIKAGTMWIGDHAFGGCSSLTSITIPNSVTSIGNYAFENCSSLTSITIPNSVTSIAYGVFRDCSSLPVVDNLRYTDTYLVEAVDKSLSTYTIKAGTMWIGYKAFSECSSLTSITIPSSVTRIGNYAFENCSSLTSITIPNSVTNIGGYAFRGCSSLTSITIPNSVTSIERYAFSDCTSLTSITIPNSVTSIERYAFSDCTSLISITIPNSVTSIGISAFRYCSALTSITIPNSVTSIGTSAFYYCSALTSITIPNSVTSIGDEAFFGSGLLDITCLAVTPPICGNNAFEDFFILTLWCPCESKEAYQSADGWSLFNDIRRIDFPQTTLLSDSESGRVQIEEWICEPQSVVISATPNVGYAFTRWNDGNTDNPRTVRLTQDTTLTAEFGLAYSGMCGDNLYWEYSSSNLQITGSGIMYDYTKSTMPWLYLRDSIYSVILPNGITYIGNWAFNGCYNLRDITSLAVTPPTCGSNVFNDVPYDATLWCPCESQEAYQSADGWSRFNDIRRINFPQATLLTDSERGHAQIDEWICEPQSVVISATPYEGYAFTRWSDGNTDNPRTIRLTQDTTLTAEFGLAYSGMCGDNLYWEYKNKKLSITGSGEMYDGTPWWLLSDSIYSVSLPNGITSIGNRAFSGCYNLVSITIPNTVTYIGSRAFADCIALPSITLPNSLTSIAYRTFSGCTALASVTIPGSVTMIGEYAFEECRKLRDIYCYAATPPTAQTNSFANYNVYVHVPCASLDAYDMDAVFGSFKYVECIGSEDADITDKTVTIVPGNADATFTWPITDGAETYTLVITKDGVTFCTLVFNKQGQLVSIAFKPARQNAPASEGTTPANYAEQTANGFRFTVTNLSEGTAYAYTLTVCDAANSVLETYTGEFTTQSDTQMGIHESAGDNTPAGQAEKILRNGQVLILRNGETYDMMGQRM